MDIMSTEWERIRACEDKMWWFRALHSAVFKIFNRVEEQSPIASVLDIGCGTGGLLRGLTHDKRELVGIDVEHDALLLNELREEVSCVQADANLLPFTDSHYDVVVCLDVLEHSNVNPGQVLKEAHRVLRDGGTLIFSVSALPWLFSRHDAAVNASRRFYKRELRRLLSENGFQVQFITYYFFLLFPLMAAWKLTHPAGDNVNMKEPVDLRLPSPFINFLFHLATIPESLLATRFSLPIGTTLLGYAHKRSTN